jgi:hypothetical protein
MDNSWLKAGGAPVIRTVLIVSMITAESMATARERQVLAGDMMKGCEAASTNIAFLMADGKGMHPKLKRSAEECVRVTQDLVSKGTENGICPDKQPVADMLAAGAIMLYLFDRPADMKRPFPEVAKKALQRHFPCR